MVLATKELPDSSPTRQGASVVKVSGQMCSDAFKIRLVVSFKVILLSKMIFYRY